jgi:succinyl-CoA synthetase beta subunit
MEIEFPVPAVVKAQAWTTSRYAKGLIRFATSAREVREQIESLRRRDVDGFPIEDVLVEERLAIDKELFFSYYIDDDLARGRYLFSTVGGSGIEEILSTDRSLWRIGDVETLDHVRVHRVREVIRKTGIAGRDLIKLADLVAGALAIARKIEARSLEINPIVRTTDGAYLAADCRITVDDYAVFRHPELGIEIARDLSHPPTTLDRIAYAVEQNDYRGTLFFTQLARPSSRKERYVGFHGAGGGGSMMSLDALQNRGYQAANYCDTSGNPPASKVYRAARIIASQERILGYFGSGSGVASQEQVHSARGLVKAFHEIAFSRPVVVRLGGNMEQEAIEILEGYTGDLVAPIRGFGKDTSVTECVEAFDELFAGTTGYRSDDGRDESEKHAQVCPPAVPPWLDDIDTYSFKSLTGTVYFDHRVCVDCPTHACVYSCVPQILKIEEGKPILAIPREDAQRGKCIECLACEVECREHGLAGAFVHLPIPGLDR